MPDKTDKQTGVSSVQNWIHILSDPTRIKIIKTLSGDRSLCAKEIQSNFDLSQPTLSHHMNVMVDARLVIATKVGRNVYYKLSKSGIRSIILFFESLLDESAETKARGEALSNKEMSTRLSGTKKTPMLPKPKSIISSPELPDGNIIKDQKNKKKNKVKFKEEKKSKKKKKKK